MAAHVARRINALNILQVLVIVKDLKSLCSRATSKTILNNLYSIWLVKMMLKR
jgi:hypothetical protein